MHYKKYVPGPFRWMDRLKRAACQKPVHGGHGQPIFEATLKHDGVLVRVDVIEPNREGV